MPIALVVLAVIAVAMLAPRLAAARARADKATQCRQIQRRLAGARVQGGDLNEAARLEADLRLCVADAQALGEPIDTSLVTIETARARLTQMQQEWGHYKSTDYADTLKRGSTLGTLYRIGDELLGMIRLAATQAESVRSIDAVRDFALEVARDSWSRAICLDTEAPGCGRYGFIEGNWDERELQELTRVLLPVLGVKEDQPHETIAVWRRARPRWEPLGLTDDFGERHWRFSREAVTTDRVARMREAGRDPLLAFIAARRAELTPQLSAVATRIVPGSERMRDAFRAALQR